MSEKYNEDFERKILDLARIHMRRGTYKLFDARARVVTRRSFPELVEKEKTGDESCLVIVSGDGETIVITEEFETTLRAALGVKE